MKHPGITSRYVFRIFAVFCTLSFFLIFSGCTVQSDDLDVNSPSVLEHPVSDAGFRRTVLYYPTDTNHIVPVVRRIPWEEGIGKAALYCLISTDENRNEAQGLGLETIIPEGVDFELTIDANKCATLNIINLPAVGDSETEQALLATVVNTLIEFPTIDSVTILLDGKSVDSLPMGTPIHENMGRIAINVADEDVATSTSDLNAVTIYYPNTSCALQIPVTVYMEQATFENAINRMLEGTDDVALKNCFPEGTSLLSATITDGIAAVNLTGEFADIANNTSGVFEALYKSIYLTASELDDVSELRLYVEGEYFMPEEVLSVSAPLYANEWQVDE